MNKGYLLRQVQPDGSSITIENPDIDMDAAKFIEMMRGFAIASGFAEETIDQYLKD